MSSIEYRLGNAKVAQDENGFAVRENLEKNIHSVGADLDLLYVECRMCGKPVLWEKGKTSRLVYASGIDIGLLDLECMILSEGCPNCRPETPFFNMQVVRVAALSVNDLMVMNEHRGSA